MRYVVDTNVMLRYLLNDDVTQSPIVTRLLTDENLEFILPTTVLNEVVWFLKKSLKVKREELSVMVEAILDTHNFYFNGKEIMLGLAFLKSGGDFADGVIAYQVSQYENASLLTFDKKAQKIARALDIAVTEPN